MIFSIKVCFVIQRKVSLCGRDTANRQSKRKQLRVGRKKKSTGRKERKKEKEKERKKERHLANDEERTHTHSALSRVSLQESPIPELTLSRHFFDFKCFFFLFSQQNRSSELGDFGEGFSEGRDQASPLVTLVS